MNSRTTYDDLVLQIQLKCRYPFLYLYRIERAQTVNIPEPKDNEIVSTQEKT